MRWRWIAAAGLVVSLALVGYAYAQEEVILPEPEPEQVQPEQPQFVVDPMAEIEHNSTFHVDPALKQSVVDPALQPLIDVAQQDLVARLGPAAGALQPLEVLEARTIVWPDGGLGCPIPGMAYIQVQVEGTLIRLRAPDGTIYQYHSGGRRGPFLCDHPDPLQIPPADAPSPPRAPDVPIAPPGFNT